MSPPLYPAPFRPRFPWWGGDLQTVANRLRPPPAGLAPHRSERRAFPLPDGTGDVLLAMLDVPAIPKPGAPLVILIHGLSGWEESLYILSMTRLLLDRGARVLRVNLRGAGPSRRTCGGQYYAGRSQDLRALLTVLPEDLTRHGLLAVGYSLGGSMLLKYLGEEGTGTPLRAAATVCSPVDLAATCRNMLRPRNRLYHHYILKTMKEEATGEGAALTTTERTAILASRTVWEYDDVFIAPRHGFVDAEDYYERCKPLHFMNGIRIPTLVLASADDPWIPHAPYRGYNWTANNALLPMLTRRGGHVGFHGIGSRQPWSDTTIARFFEHG